jgi:hypothetical protein
MLPNNALQPTANPLRGLGLSAPQLSLSCGRAVYGLLLICKHSEVLAVRFDC